MTYDELIKYTRELSLKGSLKGTERIQKMLSDMGNPQRSLSVIHVSGTNGKGSFCTMLMSVLRACGYKVGLYCSPYLESINEMYSINGNPASDSELCELAESLIPLAECAGLSEYEFYTALAFGFFSKQKVDFVIAECCMGGRYDTTNVIDSPILSVITSVELDHMAVLGGDTRQIAYHKAGIIKKGAPCLAMPCPFQAMEVIEKEAQECHALLYAPQYKSENIRLEEGFLSFDFENLKDVKIPFEALYQVRNAEAVIRACEILNRHHAAVISTENIKAGLFNTSYKARFEYLSRSPDLIFDGCHNVHGVLALSETLENLYPLQKLIFINGVMQDKDYEGIARIIARHAHFVLTVRADNPRALDPKTLASVYEKLGIPSRECDDLHSALCSALELSKGEIPIIFAGSLYMYKKVKEETAEILLNLGA